MPSFNQSINSTVDYFVEITLHDTKSPDYKSEMVRKTINLVSFSNEFNLKVPQRVLNEWNRYELDVSILINGQDQANGYTRIKPRKRTYKINLS